MPFIKHIITALLSLCLLTTVDAQQKTAFRTDKGFIQTINRKFKDAGAQYKVLAKRLPANKFPKTYYTAKGSLETSNSGWWCSGFYPGTLLFLYQQTKDATLYNAPNIPSALHDASAAAVMASALFELCRYADKTNGQRYFNAAETIIRNLSKPPYLAAKGTNGSFILQHGVGSLPQGTEIDVPLTYADYYYVEALSRYKKFN